MPERRRDALVKDSAMLAAVFERAGDANQVAQLRQIPVPMPARGEVIVRGRPRSTCLRQGAAILSFGLLDDAPAPLRNADLIYRNLSWIGFGVDHWLARRPRQRNTIVPELWGANATGSLPMPVRASLLLAALDVALQADAAAGTGCAVVALGHEA
jgi:NADPH:quinone reductase-like Zn-dependent oxidoreductase